MLRDWPWQMGQSAVLAPDRADSPALAVGVSRSRQQKCVKWIEGSSVSKIASHTVSEHAYSCIADIEGFLMVDMARQRQDLRCYPMHSYHKDVCF